MLKNKFLVLFLFLSFQLFAITTFASALPDDWDIVPEPANDPIYNPDKKNNPAKSTTTKPTTINPKRLPKRLPLGGAVLDLGVQGILDGVGWIMNEGTKVNKQTDNQKSGSSSLGFTPDSGSKILSPNTPYPLEFTFDGLSFSSHSAVKDYIISSYLSKINLKRTRRKDGLYYDKIDVFLENSSRSHSYNSSVGAFIVEVQVGYTDRNYEDNVGGEIRSFGGPIYYRGIESVEGISLSEQYKSDRDQAIASALPDDWDMPDQLDEPLELPDTKAPVVPMPLEPANDPIYDPDKKNSPDKKDKPKRPLPVVPPMPNPDVNPDIKNPVIDPVKPEPVNDPNADPKNTPDPKQNPKNNPSLQPKPTSSSQDDKETEPAKDGKDGKDATPFELPKFCDWAKPVCDFIEGLKKSPLSLNHQDQHQKLRYLTWV